MCYVTPTPRIKYLEELIRPYRATCKEEDRGDLFKEGTPPEILLSFIRMLLLGKMEDHLCNYT